MPRRGQRIEEILDVLDAVWSDDTIDIRTGHEHIAPSVMGAKPVQHPRPPILLGAHSDAGLERIARRADGWLPFGVPLDVIERQWTATLQRVEQHGRNPDDLLLVVRADPRIDAHPARGERMAFTGSCTQVMDDIERTRDIGADELILDFHASAHNVNELVDSTLCLTEPMLVAA
jgi:alkanesulfonate monooxygenase SsuD/methylene tetrahydromethanopterin reductase-like flavin-dependent oxidoreductase (luciferase family)